MNRLAWAVLLLAVVGFVSGCKVSGTISDEQGNPVQGVHVALTGKVSMNTTTDEMGQYLFASGQLVNGRFRITPVAEQYRFEPADRLVRVGREGLEQVDFTAIALGICHSNADCGAAEYCEKGLADCDGPGKCTPRPEACVQVWDPVCGCDGATYGNACLAAMAGANIQHEGPCGDANGLSIELHRSELPRELAPNISAAALDRLVADNTAFALDLYRRLTAATDGNIFYSPYSISSALSTLYGGASGQTAAQMADCLRFNLSRDEIHNGFNRLSLTFDGHVDGAAAMAGDAPRLNVENALWMQKRFPVVTDYLDLLAVHYGAGIYKIDIAAQPDPARLLINEWIARQTGDRIQHLLPQGMVTADTRLVLSNTVYLNAAWQFPFKEAATQDRSFHRSGNSRVTVPMMTQLNAFLYAENGHYQALELPYDGETLSMVLILPAAGTFDAFEAVWDGTGLADLLAAMHLQDVRLTMPRWQYRSKFGLAKVLGGLGLRDAFDPTAADFPMISEVPFWISDIIHEGFVKVDEAGTEAAAATGISSGGGTPLPKEMTLDRPFIYLIRDIPTGTLLFVGRLMDPEQ